jgi:hypothetical protein
MSRFDNRGLTAEEAACAERVWDKLAGDPVKHDQITDLLTQIQQGDGQARGRLERLLEEEIRVEALATAPAPGSPPLPPPPTP